jgi:uncharacterized protein involved in exopolysaccharide biosynthesis
MSEETRLPAPDADEIDLRAWLQALIRGWKLIVGVTVLALVAAGAYTFLQPRLYEATAVLAAMLPAAVPQGQTPPDPQVVARTALEVALTDSVVSDVYDLVRPQLRSFRDRDELRRAMEAAAGRDPRTVRLVVRSPDAAEAAAVANAWARLLVVRVNDVYLGRSPTPALALAQGNPGPGEAANPVLLQAQRDAAQADLKALQGAIYGLEGVERDIRAFRERVARADGGVVSLEDQLTALFLQLRAFGVSAPDRIEFGSEQLGGLTKDRQALLARLDDLSRAAAARRGEIEGRIAARRAEVEELGRRMQAAEFGSAVGTFVAVGAPAAAPDRPTYPRPALNLGVGGALGLVVGLAFVTAREALRGPVREPKAVQEPLPDPAGQVSHHGRFV